MKTYLIRSLKYLLWLVILFVAIFTIMSLTGTSREGALSEIFTTRRGVMMLCMIVVLALLYPRFGFTRRDVRANMPADRDTLIETFRESGFALRDETPGRMVFRAATGFKRLMLLWEDTITVESDDKYIALEGIRKEVVRLEFRLKPRLGNRSEEE